MYSTARTIARRELGQLVADYVAHTTCLGVAAIRHDALHGFASEIVTLALPLTAVTLGVLAWRARHGSDDHRPDPDEPAAHT